MSSLLQEDATCWRLTRARRVALLIDGAAYFEALRQALLKARHSVFILGWDINSEISLDPKGDGAPLREFLNRLLKERRQLQIRLLIWDWAFFFGLDRQLLPQLRFGLLASRRLSFMFDGDHPPGACQHEKIVVIDGELAFCGGIDLTVGRWDTPEHRPIEPYRQLPDGAPRPPFHDCMLMVEGETARALDVLARERWRRASGERVAPPLVDGRSPWPEQVEPWLEDASIGIARTRPEQGGQPAAREVEALYLSAIHAARQYVYIENQYLTVPAVADALAARLQDASGPEVIILGPTVCEGPVETAVMDRGRARFLDRLRAAAPPGRLRAFYPISRAGDQVAPINVHAKLMAIDDRLLVVGSANLANRSMGLDSECMLALEAEDHAGRNAVRRARDTLLAEHLACGLDRLAAEIAKRKSLIAAVDALNGGDRYLERLEVAAVDLPPEIAAGVDFTDSSEPLTVAAIQRRLTPLPRRRRLRDLALRGALLLLGLLLIAIVARSDLVGDQGMIVELLRFAERHGMSVAGFGGVVLAYTLSSLVLVPVNLMIALTAAVFGPWLGFGYALCGSLVAAAVAFGIGRRLGRDWVRRVGGRRTAAVNRRLGRHGLLAVVLLRMLPIAPFGLVNLAAGASELRARDFMLGSLIGMCPGIAIMTLFGDRLGVWLRHPDAINLLVLGVATVAALVLAIALRQWSTRQTRA
jgi:phosphatidylserine/phosphatidylglycerophosphate/cardiolipin synthase-like enzyme/uncharacterized membrane protein YdjX (TVP38/TMEM64 family)